MKNGNIKEAVGNSWDILNTILGDKCTRSLTSIKEKWVSDGWSCAGRGSDIPGDPYGSRITPK